MDEILKNRDALQINKEETGEPIKLSADAGYSSGRNLAELKKEQYRGRIDPAEKVLHSTSSHRWMRVSFLSLAFRTGRWQLIRPAGVRFSRYSRGGSAHERAFPLHGQFAPESTGRCCSQRFGDRALSIQKSIRLVKITSINRIGGAPVATGSAIGAGWAEYLRATFIFKEPYYQNSVSSHILRGLSVGVGLFQRPTARLLSQPPAESLNTDRLSAIHLYNTITDYYVKVLKDADEIDRSLQIRSSYYYSCGTVTSRVRGGAFSFLHPLSKRWLGLDINVYQSVLLPTPIEGDYGLKESMLLSGIDASYWENQIFEERYEAEAISSAKAFRVAHQDTISIYKITSAEITPFVPADGIKAGKSAGKSNPACKSTPPVNLSIEKVEDEIIVKFKSKTEMRKMRAELDKILPGNEILETSHRTSAVLIKLPKSQDLQSAISKVQANPLIEYAEPNYRYAIQSIAPNDPFFENQWGLRRCLINVAWDSIVGDSSLIIGVLDTGVDTLHPDLINRIISGYDFVNEDPFPWDDNGHGTQVCGVIGAQTDNSIGIAGIDWQAKILAVKVLNEIGIGDAFDAGQGIYYAIDNNVRIINLAFGSYDSSGYLHEAIDDAYQAGCVIVACAGNDRSSRAFYPAAYPNVIGVSATKENDLIADFSNFGRYIDFAAPGVNIYTTQRGSGYGIVSGTSYACCYVSGVASLLLAKEPFLTNQEVYDRLRQGTDAGAQQTWDPYYGWGRINAYQSLFGPIGVMPAILRYEIQGGNYNGFAEAGETFNLAIILIV